MTNKILALKIGPITLPYSVQLNKGVWKQKSINRPLDYSQAEGSIRFSFFSRANIPIELP